MEENIDTNCLQGMETQLELRDDGARYFMNQIRVPNFGDTRKLVMEESYQMRYFIHPGVEKIYLDLKNLYWWLNMKAEIATVVSKCLI